MGDQPVAVGFGDGDGLLAVAGIARADPHRIDPTAALQGPAQGMFPPAPADDEHPLQIGQRAGTGGGHGHGCKRNGRGLVGFPL